MGFTKTEICNMTLGHCYIGTYISDIDTDRTNEAINCRKFYDRAVELMYEMVPWQFAEKRWTLTDVGNPPDDWDYQYLYPNDCKRINKIVNPYKRTNDVVTDKIPYRLKNYTDSPGTGKALVTDMPDAQIDGNEWITDENMFDASFAMALSLFLATFVVRPLRCKSETVAEVDKRWAVWLSEAQVQDKLQQQDDAPRDSELVFGRG